MEVMCIIAVIKRISTPYEYLSLHVVHMWICLYVIKLHVHVYPANLTQLVFINTKKKITWTCLNCPLNCKHPTHLFIVVLQSKLVGSLFKLNSTPMTKTTPAWAFGPFSFLAKVAPSMTVLGFHNY